MTVDSIRNGIVIDHITAGRGMELYRLLGLGELDCPVALLKNVTSTKMGRKDLIKIDADIPLDTDILGYVDPGVTVITIRDGAVADKRQIALPERITNVIRCLHYLYRAGAAAYLPPDKRRPPRVPLPVLRGAGG